ncbi:membrane protein insertase YidC [Spirochaeta isovalerica]|uniref:Membrane protein insertase YidC n=1 Tax=Spirochaeta isovalerica TaxID=150 RepID=A0A841RGJ7_9SPIO|nr:membrane protein insertase YidC [Spirochaeta isovalerica]MBB6482337.1 YidC/Oxa1 family membrane protein insertase [Spirochaeta isovalerica]
MDKRTLLAVILSVIVMTGGYLLQNKLAPPAPVIEETEAAAAVETVEQETTAEPAETVTIDFEAVDEVVPARTVKVDTDVLSVEFSNSGAVITSLVLKDHLDYATNLPIDMINKGDGDYNAFNISFDEKFNQFLTENFHYENKGNGVHEFYRDFRKTGSDEVFRVVKRYTFSDQEYLFKIDVTLVDAPYSSYSLSFGPDIGPTFTKLDNRNELRRYYSYSDGKKENHKLKGDVETITNQVDWASINGKYFSLIIVPEDRTSAITWEKNTLSGYNNSSELHLTSNLSGSRTDSSYYVYAGPKNTEILKKYESSETNQFGLSESHFDEVIDSSTIPGLGWLSNILKYILIFFNKLIPNYGIAIILLTLLIKIIFYPVTHKSFESTSKMQAIQPKLKKLQDQYKNDPQKLNMATAELYKEEGVNPLGGCLPMLVQMPIFFALYGLLNSYFGLRGASFIPGWIDNLSSPESIFTLPFAIPLLGWTAVRLLPFLYLGTQLVMSRITQAGTAAAGGQSNSQMKMLTLGMPIMFFFILYDMPSGLLLYWTVTNVLSAAQQYVINKKKAAQS